MKLDMCISQTTQQELPTARSVTLLYTVCNTIYLVLLTIGVKNYETVEKLEFSSFSSALNTNTGKHHPVTYHESHREGVGAYLYFSFTLAWLNPRPGSWTPGKESLYPLYTRLGEGGGGKIWTGAENNASTQIRTPSRPALSQSLYRLHNSGPPKYKHRIIRIIGAKSSKTEKLGMIW